MNIPIILDLLQNQLKSPNNFTLSSDIQHTDQTQPNKLREGSPSQSSHFSTPALCTSNLQMFMEISKQREHNTDCGQGFRLF